MGRLDGKVAVISGAGYGLGRGIALALGKEGAKVATIGRTESKLLDFMDQMKERGYEADYFVGDVGIRQNVKDFIQQVVDKWGTVDIVVNNAMAFNYRPFMETTEEDIQLIFNSACMGTIYMMQEAFPYLKVKGGKVINFASIAGMLGMVNHASYALAKEGIVGLTRVVALEWAPYNIQVNAIAPAGATPAWEKFQKDEPDQIEGFLSQIPAHRMGDPETEIGPVVAFLASEESNWITSRVIPVDGGQASTR